MDHSEATRIKASERYVLGELTPSEVEAFEEHFFSCATCAKDLTFENEFAENVKAVFREQTALAQDGSAPALKPRWWEDLPGRWKFATWAPLVSTACLMAVVGFQNLTTIPQLRTEVAQVTSGEAPFPFPLKIARGTDAINVPKSAFLFMPYFFLPGGVASAHYICDIETTAGVRVKHLTVSAPPAGQPLALLLKRSDFPSGIYHLNVRSENQPDPIATYTVTLNTD
ncbi:MAG: zf-HC2 domain-containing protein [Acidobacteriota bacterium]|nr:zf-HC2 domain-containing protein [Acidobacteriota bacterium]